MFNPNPSRSISETLTRCSCPANATTLTPLRSLRAHIWRNCDSQCDPAKLEHLELRDVDALRERLFANTPFYKLG